MELFSSAVLWGGLAGLVTVLGLWACARIVGKGKPNKNIADAEDEMGFDEPKPEPQTEAAQEATAEKLKVSVKKWVEPGAQRKTKMLPKVRQTIEKAALRGLRDWVCDFPPLAPIVPKLLSEVRSPEPNMDRIVDLLLQDPVLCSELLQLANSASIAPARPVTSVLQAVSMLGYDAMLTVAMQGALTGLLRKPVPGGFNHQALLAHGVATGLFAGVLGRRFGRLDLGVSVTAGLLHDLGKLAMNVSQPSLVRELLAVRSNKLGESRLAKEERLFGASHAVIGALLAEHWGLPETLGGVIELHHYPAISAMTVGDSTTRRLSGVVMIANQIAKYADFPGDDAEIDVPDTVVFEDLGLPPDYEEIQAMIQPEVSKRLEAFRAQYMEPAA